MTLREQFETENTVQSNDEFYWRIYSEWLEAKFTSHNKQSTPCCNAGAYVSDIDGSMYCSRCNQLVVIHGDYATASPKSCPKCGSNDIRGMYHCNTDTFEKKTCYCCGHDFA